VPACRRVDDASDDAQFHDASHRDRDVKGPGARRIAKRLLERQEHRSEAPDWERVDVHSLQNSDARSIGIEHAALEALKRLDLPNQLCALGLNKRQQGCALANIIGRRTQPGSERATHAWLRTSSATGERLGIDFGSLSDRALYRASDHLFKHKKALENHMFGAVETLFNRPAVAPTDTVASKTRTDTDRHGHPVMTQQEPNSGRKEKTKEKTKGKTLCVLPMVQPGFKGPGLREPGSSQPTRRRKAPAKYPGLTSGAPLRKLTPLGGGNGINLIFRGY